MNQGKRVSFLISMVLGGPSSAGVLGDSRAADALRPGSLARTCAHDARRRANRTRAGDCVRRATRNKQQEYRLCMSDARASEERSLRASV